MTLVEALAFAAAFASANEAAAAKAKERRRRRRRENALLSGAVPSGTSPDVIPAGRPPLPARQLPGLVPVRPPGGRPRAPKGTWKMGGAGVGAMLRPSAPPSAPARPSGAAPTASAVGAWRRQATDDKRLERLAASLGPDGRADACAMAQASLIQSARVRERAEADWARLIAERRKALKARRKVRKP